MKDHQTSVSILSGAVAGLCVDVALFPLDTVKTRLQSADGFLKTGGFRGIYRGLGSAVVGSMPSAALFFCTYDAVKRATAARTPQPPPVISQMLAAATGETVACLVRVPVEVVKQRAMTSQHTHTSLGVLTYTIRSQGILGLYQGYFSTVFREIPFSLIQFPMWEYLKSKCGERQHGVVHAWQSAACGAIAGGTAAAVTTPLDVAKTRIMLAQSGSDLAKGNILRTIQTVYAEKGFKGLYAGVVPRTLWISIGGAIFLGVYDKVKTVVTRLTASET